MGTLVRTQVQAVESLRLRFPLTFYVYTASRGRTQLTACRTLSGGNFVTNVGVLRIGVGLSDRACVGLSWQDKSKLTNELPCVSLSLGTFDIFLYSHE